MVAKAIKVGQSTPGPFGILRPRFHQGVDIDHGGIFPIHQRFGAIVRAPEIHNIIGVISTLRIDGHHPRIGGNKQGDRAAALRGFAGTSELVASNIGRQHQRFFGGISGHKTNRQLQGGGGAITRLLQLNATATGIHIQQTVHINARSLRLVDPAFGRKQQQLHLIELAIAHQRISGAGRQRHDILIGRRHAHFFLPDSQIIFIGIDRACRREALQIHIIIRGIKTKPINSNIHLK